MTCGGNFKKCRIVSNCEALERSSPFMVSMGHGEVAATRVGLDVVEARGNISWGWLSTVFRPIRDF